MDTHPGSPAPEDSPTETPAARAARLRREDAAVAQGLADIAAGRCLDEAEADAWLAAREHDPHLPMPEPWSSRHRA